jgi:hypothetical protein
VSGVRIFQIYYRAAQLPQLDPAFVPYDNIGELSPLLELNVFRKVARLPESGELDYWGAVSWKFGQKAGLTGEALLGVLRDNPGYDVYFCNPHPDTEALYHNLWVQGETSHPQFLALAREIFAAAGLDAVALEGLWPASLYAAANYFVATPAFWSDYLDFTARVVDALPERLSPLGKAMLHSPMADAKGAHANASYLPFVVERLFSTFLLARSGKYRAYKYLTDRSLLERNIHLRHLREMKDEAVRTGSQWLASCWTHYRRLYLAQIHGLPWLKKYQPLITPRETRFLGAHPEIAYPVARVDA